MPSAWYNLRADMKNKPAPLLNPDTREPMTYDDLRPVFCDELIRQELDDTTPYIDIPEPLIDFYKMYRPSPLVRAYCLEEKLQPPAKIYYKFEGNNTSGSHKLNSAIAQAYYAKQEGLKGVTTETGAGQWGTALSMACSYFGLDCQVYMVKCSYEQKPFRREVMRTYGASVTPSPSMETEVGKKILAEHPGTTGSLGCAISEAVEKAESLDGYRYVLGSVLNQVMLHQTVIGLECKTAMDKYGVKPDVIIGCAGGGSIVFINSNTAYRAVPDRIAYVTSKGGQLGLMRALAIDLGKYNIRVNAVLPGMIRTDRWEKNPGFYRDVPSRFTPIGDVAVGEDVADAVYYFAAHARNTTGAELVVDGGNTIQLYPIIPAE